MANPPCLLLSQQAREFSGIEHVLWSQTCVHITAPKLTCWMTLGITLAFSESLFPLLQNGTIARPAPELAEGVN